MNDSTFLDDTSADNAETDQALRDAFGALAGAFATVDTAGVIRTATDSAATSDNVAASGPPLLTVVSDPEAESQAADTEPPLHEPASGPRRHALRWALIAAALIAAAIGGWAISRYRADGPSVVRSVSPTEEGSGPGAVPPAILAEGNLVWVPEEWPEELADAEQIVGPAQPVPDDWERVLAVGPDGESIDVVKRPAPAVTTTRPGSVTTVDASAVEIRTQPGFVHGTWTKDGSLYQATAQTPSRADGSVTPGLVEATTAAINAIAAEPWESLPDKTLLGDWTVLDRQLSSVVLGLQGQNYEAVVGRSNSTTTAFVATLKITDAPAALEKIATVMGWAMNPIGDISTMADPKAAGDHLAAAWAPDDSHVAIAHVLAGGDALRGDASQPQEASANDLALLIGSARPLTLDKAGTWVDTREPNPGEFRNSGDETKVFQQGSFPDGNKFRVYDPVDSDRLLVEYLLADDSQMGISLLVRDPSGDDVQGPSIDQWIGDSVYTEIAQLVAAGEHDPAKIKLTVSGKNVPLGGYYDEATDTTHAFGLVIKVPIDQRAQGGPYKDVVVTLGD